MSRFKKEVYGLLQNLSRSQDRLWDTLKNRDILVRELKIELEIQRRENQRLRDAFMAQDFEKFRLYTPEDSPQWSYTPTDDRVVSQSDLEAFVGESVEGPLAEQLSGEEIETKQQSSQLPSEETE